MPVGMDQNSYEIFLIIRQAGFEAFTKGMNIAKKKMGEMVSTVKQTSQSLQNLAPNLTVFGNAKHQQAMDSYATNFKHVNKELDKIRPDASKIFDGVRVSSMNSKEAIGEMLQSQKSASIWQKEYYTGLQKSLKPLAEETRNALMANVKPSSTAEQAVQGLLNRQKELSSWSKQYGKEMISTDNVVGRLRKQYDSFAGAMSMGMDQFRTFNTEGGKFNTIGGKMGNRLRMMTHGARGFRMELLGVMFFGMAVQKFFTGMLKPAANLFGIFELWGVLLQIVFLDVMTDLFDIFMKFFNWVLTWSDDTKTFVGWFTVFGAVLGTVTFMVGMLGLGIGSLIMAFGFLGIAVTAGTLGYWGIVLLGVIGVVALVIIYHKQLTKGLLNLGLVVLTVAHAFGTLQWRYENWKATQFDPFGVWQRRADISSEGLDNIEKAMSGWQEKWENLTRELDEENNSQADSVDAATQQMEMANASLAESHAALTNAQTTGNDETLKSTFETYVQMFGAQSTVYSEMIAATTTFVDETNSELSRIGTNRRSSGHPLQSTPDAISSLIAYAESQGAYGDIYIENNINVSDKAEMEKMIDENNKNVAEEIRRIVKTPT